jgi:hypothetical protein
LYRGYEYKYYIFILVTFYDFFYFSDLNCVVYA